MEEKGTCGHKGRMKKDSGHLGPGSHVVGEGERESERHTSMNPERLRTWAQPYQTGVKRRPQGRAGVPGCKEKGQEGERAGRTSREVLIAEFPLQMGQHWATPLLVQSPCSPVPQPPPLRVPHKHHSSRGSALFSRGTTRWLSFKSLFLNGFLEINSRCRKVLLRVKIGLVDQEKGPPATPIPLLSLSV